MTRYYTIADSTGTCSDYFNGYLSQISTTSTGTGSNNWNYFSEMTSTTSTSIPYGQTYIGNGYSIQYLRNRELEDKPSEQELLKRREERAKAEEVAKKAREKAAEAGRKARLLLLEYLDDENSKRLLNKEPLEVPSRLFGDIKYHIPVSNGRIMAWKENKVVTELCLTVRESGCLPTDDIVLTKFLHVLHDEENMLRTANHFNAQENLLARLN
jgi:hypothetical protein